MTKYFLTLYRISVAIVLISCQQAIAQKINNTKMASSNFCDTIPFEYVRNKIIITATINNQVGRFIVDTGAPLMVSSAFQKVLNLTTNKGADVTDISGKTQQIPLVALDSLTIGNATFSQASALVYDINSNAYLKCLGVDGLIGSDIFKHTVLHIDTRKKIIILSDKNRLAISGNNALKMKLDATSRPFIKVQVDQKTNVDVLFDSGSDKFFPLLVSSLDKLKHRNHVTILNQGHGALSAGLFGNSEQGAEYRLLLQKFSLGTFSLDSIITTASQHKKKDALGMAIGEYGTITIDYPKKRFYFQPYHKSTAFIPSKFFGFSIQLADGKAFVSIVYEDSPAAKAGVKVGQQLLKIGERDLAVSSDICSLYLDPIFNSDSITVTLLGESDHEKTVTLNAQ